VIDAPFVILEGAYLESPFPLHLYMVRMSIGEVLDHLRIGGKAIEWPWKDKVTYLWCPSDSADEGGSHHDRLAPEPSMKE
jgi:hypothetical protein